MEMYFEVHGTGRPLLSIHPACGMANVFPSLVPGRSLIAMDLQGHGRTVDVDRPLSFVQQARELCALLDFLGIETADVLGEGFGGTVALCMAAFHPGRVRRVALYGAATRVAGHPPIDSEHPAVAFERANYRRIAADPDQWPRLFRKVHEMRWGGLSPEEARSIRCPLLIGLGDHDYLPVVAALELSRQVQKAQLAVIPNAGHFLLNVDADRFLVAVKAFLDEPELSVPFAVPTTGYQPGLNR